MSVNVIIAIIDGLLQQLPSVVSAYQQWVTVVNAGQDPTAAQLKLTEAAVDAMYAKLRALTAQQQLPLGTVAQ